MSDPVEPLAAPVGNTTHASSAPTSRPLAILIVSVRLNQLSLLEQVVLALVVEAPSHGFGVASAIEADAALAMAITVRRPLVYRAIDTFARAGMLRRAKVESGQRGAPRTVYRATAAGSRASAAWLRAIVDHPRDARLELLAKFALRARRGMSNRSLAAAQRRHFEPVASSLRQRRRDETPAAALVRRWRYESVAAMIGLLRDVENDRRRATAAAAE